MGIRVVSEERVHPKANASFQVGLRSGDCHERERGLVYGSRHVTVAFVRNVGAMRRHCSSLDWSLRCRYSRPRRTRRHLPWSDLHGKAYTG
jgi:hypothetical protein